MFVNLFDPEKADLRQSINLEASAGTGKTYNLERVVCELVERYDLGIEEILVVTFTNKAASELKERIRILLDKRAAEGKESLQKARRNFDKAPIYTIHAFCQTVLKSYPFESGSPFSQELLSDNSLLEEGIEEVLYREFMNISDGKKDLIRSYFSSGMEDCISSLVKEVKAVLEDSNSLRLPEQGTIDMVLREKELYARGEGEIRRAADALCAFAPDKDRILAIMKHLPVRNDQRTAANAVKAWDSLAPAEGLGEWLTQFVESGLLGKIEFLSEAKRVDKLPELDEDIDLCRAVDDLFEALSPLLDPDDVSRTIYDKTLGFSFLKELLDRAVDVIQKKKRLRGAMDFSDLIGILADLLEKDRKGPLVEVLRSQYQVVLVDEFQDTDKKQWSIFSTLFDSPGHNYFLIGDPKQSIYGFRGADLEVYKEACSSVSDENSYSLSTNYRSRKELVEACNLIFDRVFSYKIDGCTDVSFTPVESGNETAPGVVDSQGQPLGAVQLCEINIDAEDNKTANKSKLQEAWMEWAVRETACILKGGCRFELNGVPRVIQPGDIAFLAESNAVCQDIQKHLSEEGISSVIFSDRKIIESRDAEVFGSLLNALAYPDSKSASLALLMTSAFDLSSEDVQILQEGDSYQEYLLYLQNSRELCNRGDLIGFFRSFFEEELPLSFMNGQGSWRNRLLKRAEGLRSSTNLTHLAEIFHGEQKQRSLDMGELYDHYLQMKNSPEDGDERQVRLDQDGQAVQILTHHASKGLEFPIVFFFGADKSGVTTRDGEPLDYYWDRKRYRDYLKTKKNRKKADLSAWEERKRLYYVSLTRASSLLYMPWFPEGDFTYLTTIYAALGGDDLVLEEDELFEAESLKDIWPVHAVRSDNFKKLKAPLNTAGAKKRVFNDRISDALSSLASGRRQIFNYRTDNPDPGALASFSGTEEAPQPLTLARKTAEDQFGRRITRVVSFSSLTSDVHDSVHPEDDADRDSQEESPDSEELTGALALTRGAVFGNLVHCILEEIDYSWASRPLSDWLEEEGYSGPSDIFSFIEDRAVRFFDQNWWKENKAPLCEMVQNVLNTPLEPVGPLRDLSPEQRKHELEFLMTTTPGTMSLEDWQAAIDKGYLKGFIDLIFEKDGRLYIADWKTTVPPGKGVLSDYSPANLKRTMALNRYDLQAMIYAHALRRYMLSLNPGFDYEKEFGGIYYFFVRGMGRDSGNGVHFVRPSETDVLNLMGEGNS